MLQCKDKDGNPIELHVRTSSQSININYELQELSNRDLVSIDRGALSDRYSTTLNIHGDIEYIESVRGAILGLRRDKKSVVLSGFLSNVGLFGDHVDYSNDIDCAVLSMGDVINLSNGSYSFDIELLATGIVTIGTSEIPQAMECLQGGYSKGQTWNTTVSETYYRNNFVADREADRYTFSGSYILTEEENRNLYKFWETNRGLSVLIDETQFGVTNMFGVENSASTMHNVIFKSVSYSRLSPTHRTVQITLIRQGQ